MASKLCPSCEEEFPRAWFGLGSPTKGVKCEVCGKRVCSRCLGREMRHTAYFRHIKSPTKPKEYYGRVCAACFSRHTGRDR
jgi:hypothetical protein